MFTLFFIVNGCVVVLAFWQCVMKCGVCHYVGAKWLWWVVCVCVFVGWVLLAVQVWKCVGGKRCVDLETQKHWVFVSQVF